VSLVSFDADGNLINICTETEQIGEQQCDTLMNAQPNLMSRKCSRQLENWKKY